MEDSEVRKTTDNILTKLISLQADLYNLSQVRRVLTSRGEVILALVDELFVYGKGRLEELRKEIKRG